MPLHLRAGHPRPGLRQLLLVWPEDREPRAQADDPDGPDARQPDAAEHPLQVAGKHGLRADPRGPLGRFEAARRPPQPRGMGPRPVQPQGSQQAEPRRVRAKDDRSLRRGRRDPQGRPLAREGAHLRRWNANMERADHQREEGVPVHPGRLLQAELPDGLPRSARRSYRQPHAAASHPTASTGS